MLPGRRSLPMTSRVRAALASEVERLAPARAPFPAIDPVLIAIGPFAIRWYALAYIAGIVLGWRLVRLVQRPGWALTPEAIDDLVFYVTLGVILGGRIGYVLFYQPATISPSPGHAGRLARRHVLPWRADRRAGRDLLFARRRGFAFFELTDALAGHADRIVPRADRQLHQRRAVGKGTDLPWGVVFPTAGPEPRHPSQLYEAGWRACSCSW